MLELQSAGAVQADDRMRQYGPFGLATAKSFSITRRSVDGRSLLKIYRGVEPLARRDREADALMLAAQWGLSVPAVLDIGELADTSWAVLGIVPGKRSSTTTASETDAYVHCALALCAVLHQRVDGLTPGSGWQQCSGIVTHRHSLLEQLSPRCRQQPWWKVLYAELAPLDEQPTVYLHGDIKPEHLLVDDETVHIVDWEASARGPAVCDHADIMFHLVRDLVYAEGDVDSQRLPVDVLSQVPVVGPVLAWRVVRWLDRRRLGDIEILSPDILHRLADTPTPTDAVRALGSFVTRCRDHGVPR